MQKKLTLPFFHKPSTKEYIPLEIPELVNRTKLIT